MTKKAKLISYFLILTLVIFAGFFSLAPNAQAQEYVCTRNGQVLPNTVNEEFCKNNGGSWDIVSTTPPTSQNTAQNNNSSGLAAHIPGCMLITGDFDDCLVKISYYAFYSVPSFLLALSAKFLNIVIPLALSSVMYTSSSFIPEAWVIVRDLSNIFFIFILLYIAFQTILGLGGHGGGPKKMIAQVIIMALLINFSMFFTKIIIDSSNILALVFYNRISVETKEGGQERPYLKTTDSSQTGVVEKDISGALVSSFDITRLMSDDFYDQVTKRTRVFSAVGLTSYTAAGAVGGSFIPIVGTGIGAAAGAASYFLSYAFSGDQIPPGLLIGIILVTGSIMLYAAYSFLLAGIAFVGRLIELWILIIFSPFAFMSSVVPKLSHIDGVGWESWLKRLLSTAFMAPIFMFFLYIIFKIIQIDIFKSLTLRTMDQQETTETIVLIALSAIVILVLLKKAVAYAKKGGGELGEAMLKGLKSVGGLAGGAVLGTTVGLTASAGRQTFGRVATELSELRGLKDAASQKGLKGALARGTLGTTRTLSGASFDARGIPGAGKVLGAAGFAKGAGLVKKQEGGFAKDLENKAKRQEAFADSLKVGDLERERRGISAEQTETESNTRKDDYRKTIEEGALSMLPSNKMAAIRIKDAKKRKLKKLQDAAIALAEGGGNEKKAEGATDNTEETHH